MNEFYVQAGKRIKETRLQRRYTREEFAESVQISSKFLYQIESGKRGFSADTLFRIAKGLNVTCEYLLDGQKYNSISNVFFDEQTIKLVSDFQREAIQNLLEIISKRNINE